MHVMHLFGTVKISCRIVTITLIESLPIFHMQLQHLLLLASYVLKSIESSSYLRRGRAFIIYRKSIESTEAKRRPVYVKARRKYSFFLSVEVLF